MFTKTYLDCSTPLINKSRFKNIEQVKHEPLDKFIVFLWQLTVTQNQSHIFCSNQLFFFNFFLFVDDSVFGLSDERKFHDRVIKS